MEPRQALTNKRPNCLGGAFSESFSSTLLSIVSHVYIFWVHILTFESLFVLLSAAGATSFFVFYTNDGDDGFVAAKLDFALLSMAIVFPLHFLLDQTFKRREQALAELAEVKGLIASITISLLTWDFPSNVSHKYDGRSYLPQGFNAQVMNNASRILVTLKQYLRMPTVTRNVNMVLYYDKVLQGKEDEERTMERLLGYIHQSYYLVEIMKERGLPPNEASRVNGYHTSLVSRLESVRNFKWYRTPHATRAFGFVYIVILPWFYGPYYAWVAGRVVRTVFDFDSNQPTERIKQSAATAAFAICLALVTALVLVGLISVQRLLEDPFLEHGADYIDVERDIEALTQSLQARFRAAERRNIPKLDFAAAIERKIRYDIDGRFEQELELLDSPTRTKQAAKTGSEH